MTTLDAMITMVTHTVVIAPLECEVPMKLATVMAAVERHEKSATRRVVRTPAARIVARE